MSSKCMDESLEEGSRLQQHYCITLGVGPLWWSWCAPCRIVCIYSQHREPRRGDQAESALCELPHCASTYFSRLKGISSRNQERQLTYDCGITCIGREPNSNSLHFPLSRPTGGWIVESCEKQRTIASNVHSPLDWEYIRRVGDRSMAPLSIHSRTKLPSARRIKRGLCLTLRIRRGNTALHQYHCLPSQR